MSISSLIKIASPKTTSGGKAMFRRLLQLLSAAFPILIMLTESLRENMDLHHINILPEITVMRGWDPKLVNMQSENAPLPILSMPLWRRMGNQREDTNAHSLIFLSEEY